MKKKNLYTRAAGDSLHAAKDESALQIAALTDL